MGKMNGRTAVPISGANKQSYTIKNATADDGGSYRVTATNEHGSVSSKAAKLQVLSVPVITKQFSDTLLLEGGTAYFQVLENPKVITQNKLGKSAKLYMVVDGSPKLTYKWFKDGSPIIGATKNKIGLKGKYGERQWGLQS